MAAVDAEAEFTWEPEYDLAAAEQAICSGDVAGLEKNQKLRCQADVNGKALLATWYKARQADIATVMALFDGDGVYREPLHATVFNDLYKWTMAPVIRKLETYKPDGRVCVTFGIDLRDETMRSDLLTSFKAGQASGRAEDRVLENKIWTALKGLESRPFDREIFTSILQGPRAALAPLIDIDAICGPAGGPPRMLVEAGGVKPLDTRYTHSIDEDSVSVCFYYNPDAEYVPGGAEKGVHFIEATGPWHKVSWLETSLMQCVYEAKLRFDLETKTHKSYDQWLHGALLRCAKSVAFTRLVQASAPSPAAVIKPALFTGRRTGGLLFLLLQNLFFADHFTQLGPAYNPPPGALKTVDIADKTPCLGSSSCDSWYILTRKLNLPCLNPAGTHAHELSMVTSTLFPQLDQNELKLPITQVVGHYLYSELVQKKTGGPMPMLPDTLGTRAFMKAATYITLPDGAPFLSIINSARQDSGELPSFKANMAEFGYKGGMMASEIDTTATLVEAADLGYASFGAGGFFGDSEKVWGRKDAASNSMAVKAVRVVYKGAVPAGIPYIQSHPEGVIGYPIKIGDPKLASAPVLGAKLSLDKNLPPELLGPIVEYAKTMYPAHDLQNGAVTGTKPLSELFVLEKPTGVHVGGRRKTRKGKGKRSTRKFGGFRNKRTIRR
jgi:hypothetical protein